VYPEVYIDSIVNYQHLVMWARNIGCSRYPEYLTSELTRGFATPSVRVVILNLF